MEILEYFTFKIFIRVLLKYFLTNLNKNSVFFFYLEKFFKILFLLNLICTYFIQVKLNRFYL